MAVVAPIPSASVRIATIVNPGLRSSVRIAYRMSLMGGVLVWIPCCSLDDCAPHSGRRRLAFITARGAPPPLALARRLRASLGPQALFPLFRPQCRDRIHTRSAPRRNVGRDECDANQNGGDGDIGQRIGAAHVKKKHFQESRRYERACYAQSEASRCEQEPLTHDGPDDLIGAGSERDPNADLTSALHDGETHQAKNPDGGEDQRDQRE